MRSSVSWSNRLFTAAAFAVLLAAPARAADADARATLRGLKGVRIVVEDVSAELRERGITEDVVLAETERQLRQGGIPIYTEKQRRAFPGEPVLHVQVLAQVDVRFDEAAFGVRLELRQNAHLERDRSMRAPGVTTWSTGGIGEAARDWRQVLRDEVAYHAGRFVEAWQEANPPARSTE